MSEQAKAVILSWFKVFVAASLTAFLGDLAAEGFEAVEWQSILIAGIVAVGPVIVNWLDPTDTRYGRGYEGA